MFQVIFHLSDNFIEKLHSIRVFYHYFQTSDTVFDAALAFALLFWSVIQILIFCESGERLTNQFMKINDGIFDSEWYTFSDDLQRKLPIIISGTRLPTYICGYGNILCTRDTCKSVNFETSLDFFISYNFDEDI